MEISMNKNLRDVADTMITAWNNSIIEIRKLNSRVAITQLPNTNIFEEDKSCPLDAMNFKMTPVVFDLPEHATQSKNSLFLVLSGKLSFVTTSNFSNLVTKSYSTQIEYFRKGNNLKFIGTVHYDFDKRNLTNHPKFHSQFSNKISEFEKTHLKKSYPSPCKISNFIESARIPTVQLDCYSALLQICADHLVHNTLHKEIFKNIRTHCNFFRSIDHPLQIKNNLNCIRSIHFYPNLSNNSLNFKPNNIVERLKFILNNLFESPKFVQQKCFELLNKFKAFKKFLD